MTGAARVLYGVQRVGPDDLLQDVPVVARSRACTSRRTALISKPSSRRGWRSAARGSPRCRSAFRGRTFEEGKKIRAFDAVRVMRELIRCKFRARAAWLSLDKPMVGVILAAGKGARMYPVLGAQPEADPADPEPAAARPPDRGDARLRHLRHPHRRRPPRLPGRQRLRRRLELRRATSTSSSRKARSASRTRSARSSRGSRCPSC